MMAEKNQPSDAEVFEPIHHSYVDEGIAFVLTVRKRLGGKATGVKDERELLEAIKVVKLANIVLILKAIDEKLEMLIDDTDDT